MAKLPRESAQCATGVASAFSDALEQPVIRYLIHLHLGSPGTPRGIRPQRGCEEGSSRIAAPLVSTARSLGVEPHQRVWSGFEPSTLCDLASAAEVRSSGMGAKSNRSGDDT